MKQNSYRIQQRYFLLYKTLKCVFGGEKDLWRIGRDSICFWAPCLGHRSEEQSELCLKGDDTHRNVNGPEYFRGRIITWQKEDGWVSRKRLAVGAPLCYCKPGVEDDFNARLTRSSCCLVVSLSAAPLLPDPVSFLEFWGKSRRIPLFSPTFEAHFLLFSFELMEPPNKARDRSVVVALLRLNKSPHVQLLVTGANFTAKPSQKQ